MYLMMISVCETTESPSVPPIQILLYQLEQVSEEIWDDLSVEFQHLTVSNFHGG
jgi:hypothetical protein